MEGGVGPHQPVAPIPIDHSLDLRSRLKAKGVGNNVQDPSLAADRVDDLDLSTCVSKRPDVSGLASPACVEDGAIEHHAFGRDLNDPAFCGGSIGICGGNFLGQLTEITGSGAGIPRFAGVSVATPTGSGRYAATGRLLGVRTRKQTMEGNKMRKRDIRFLATIGLLALVLAACGGTAATTTAGVEPGALGVLEVGAGEPIKIASLQVISGDNTSLGLDQVRGIEIAITDRGEIAGHAVELAFNEDDLCNSEGGQTGATRIIADPQVIAVIGTSCSGAGVPASNVITSANRVLISGSNTSPVLTSDLAGNEAPEHHDGYFRTAHNDAIQGAAAAKFVFEELGLTQVATINDGDPYTQGLTSAFEGPFEELGGTIVLSTAVTADQTDMRPVLTEVAAAGAELIFFPIFQPAGDFVAEQALEIAGLEDTILMGADGLLSDTYVVLPQTEGMYFSGPTTPTTPAYDEFVTKYEAAYGEAPIQAFHAHAYDATLMVLTAIESVAQVSGDSLVIDLQGLRDELHSMTYEGLTGTLSCDEFGDCASPSINILQNTEAEPDIAAVRGNVLATYTREDLGL